jgi:hypothetical protein
MLESVTFHFHKNKGIISQIVQWRTASGISHVSVEVRGFSYNAYVDSRFYKSPHRADDIVESYSICCTTEQVDAIEELLNKQLFAMYDYKSILGFILNKSIQSKGRVYCSEIAYLVLQLIAPGKLNYKKLITPEDIRVAVIYFLKGIELAIKRQK